MSWAPPSQPWLLLCRDCLGTGLSLRWTWWGRAGFLTLCPPLTAKASFGDTGSRPAACREPGVQASHEPVLMGTWKGLELWKASQTLVGTEETRPEVPSGPQPADWGQPTSPFGASLAG